MAKNEITFDMWMDELAKQGPLNSTNATGQTTVELAEELGCSRDTVIKHLKTARVAGRLVIGKSTRVRIDGQTQQVPVYKFLAKSKTSKKG